MAIFEVGLKKVVCASVFIEAETEEEARQIVFDGDYDMSEVREDFMLDDEWELDGMIYDVTDSREPFECANHDED